MQFQIAFANPGVGEGSRSFEDPFVAAIIAAGMIRNKIRISSVVCCDDAGYELAALRDTSRSDITPEQMKADVLSLAERWM